MAIIIENLNMPSTCTMCWISNICQEHIHDLNHIGYEKRLDDCPLREVVHGEWTDTTHGLICSACKTYQVYGSRFYNFCPICGADMRGGDNGDPEDGADI